MLWRPKNTKKNFLSAVYIAMFFLNLHAAITSYTDSTFISQFFGEKGMGLVFAAGSVLTIGMLIIAPAMLRLVGNYVATQFLLLMEITLLIMLPLWNDPFLVGLIFIIHIAIATVLLFNLDIFNESKTTSVTEGKMRGFFLTAGNLAYLLGAATVGAIMVDEQFFRVYLASAISTLPVLFVVIAYLHNFKDPKYHEVKLKEAINGVIKNNDLLFITCANFLLQFFYSIMVIYTPAYLNLHMGFNWETIGSIFFVMLLPFVIFEIPLGKIADERLGEKEILIAGFLLTAITTFSLSYLPHSVWIWAAILFMTRVGAAAIEIMSETYFFKKVDAGDAGLISVFRYARPLGYIIGPVSASLFLIFFPLRAIFIALGIIMFTGIFFAIKIRDTK